MKTVLTRLWQAGRLTEDALARAVTLNWVTTEEANEIKLT